MDIAILAGGMATRLYPLTLEIPKSMISVAGKPFIDWQIKLLANSGFKKIVLCVGVKSHTIVDFVGDGSKYDLEVVYSYDGDSPLGTGGAIVKALPILGETFGVVYGDSYLPIDFKKVKEHFHLIEENALITVYKNNNRYDLSNVLFKDEKIIQYSKYSQAQSMQHIDYGFSIFHQEIFEKCSKNTNQDLATLLEDLAVKNRLAGYEVNKRFYEVGSFHGIEEFSEFIKGETI